MTTSTFGSQLKHWRAARGLSQLDLAVLAHVNPREVSAFETGKAVPNLEVLRAFGDGLAIPLREQNVMCAAAGLHPAFPETPLDELGEVVATLDQLLAAHEPNMAIVLDRHWNLIRSNPAGARFMFTIFADPPDWIAPPLNFARLMLHPEGLRRHMLDWEATAGALLARLEKSVADHPNDEVLEALLLEVIDHPDVTDLPRRPSEVLGADVLRTTTYKLGDQTVRLFTTVTTISDARDLTLDELRIETSLPADAASQAAWQAGIGGA